MESSTLTDENITPILTINEAENIAEKLYDIKVKKITQLNGFDDKNYHIITDENEYVLKIINNLDSKQISFIEAQGEMMLFLSKNNFNCSYPIKNKNGDYFSTENLKSGNHVVRLLTYLPGKLFCEMEMTNDNFFEVGKYAAKLDLLLEFFYHSAYKNHKTLWMLDAVPEIKNYTHVITDQNDKKLIENIIEEFETRVLADKHYLKHSFIHGDLNEQNIIVKTNEDGSWTIHGLLDFGDSQYSAVVFELALVMTYMILQGKSLEAAGHVIAGYETVRKIPEEEYAILKICIAARLCQSLVLGLYTHLQHPDNAYVLTTQKNGWKILKELWSTPDKELHEMWKNIQQTYC